MKTGWIFLLLVASVASADTSSLLHSALQGTLDNISKIGADVGKKGSTPSSAADACVIPEPKRATVPSKAAESIIPSLPSDREPAVF